MRYAPAVSFLSTCYGVGLTLVWAALFGVTHVQASEPMNAGQRLTMVMTSNEPGGGAARKVYLDNALAMGIANGIEIVHVFGVKRTIVGNEHPEGIGFYEWPSPAAAEKVRLDPEYLSKYAPLRAKAWKMMHMADFDLNESVSISVDASKTYTLAQLWLKDAAAYKQYVEQVQDVRKKLGISVIFKAKPDQYEVLRNERRAPDVVVLMEWPNPESVDGYALQPEVKNALPALAAALEHMEWYELSEFIPY